MCSVSLMVIDGETRTPSEVWGSFGAGAADIRGHLLDSAEVINDRVI